MIQRISNKTEQFTNFCSKHLSLKAIKVIGVAAIILAIAIQLGYVYGAYKFFQFASPTRNCGDAFAVGVFAVIFYPIPWGLTYVLYDYGRGMLNKASLLSTNPQNPIVEGGDL